MIYRLKSLIRKEFLQTFRDVPIVLLVLYVFTEIALCGWALTMDVRHIPTAVLDRDQSAASRALLERFRQADSFKIDFVVTSELELDRLMDRGDILIGLILPPRMERDLAQGKPVTMQAIADGTQTNTALIALSYVEQITGRYSTQIQVDRLDQLGKAQTIAMLPAVVNQIRAWYVPDMAYIHYGMISMVSLAVVMIGIQMSSASVMREKEVGTLEQLMVTPIRPLELILAKLLPMVILEIIGLIIGLLIAYFVFGVSAHGNPWVTLPLFFGLSTLAFLASSGIGMWIATVAKNLQQSLMIAFLILFPVMFLSGTLVPITSMPVWLQWVSFFSPMRHYLSIALSLFLKGTPIHVVGSHVALLAAFVIIIMGIAVARFRRIYG
jgi:ABC-2 type transport system permease protein